MNLSSNFIGQCYSSNNFLWDKASQTFIADISDVPAVLRQMFNDSLDLGFAMQSAKTGDVLYFTLATAERDREGDMAVWTFEPLNCSHSLQSIKVRIFND